MGFTRPDLLAVDPDKFLQKPLMERMRILGADWAENGFGSPKMVHTIYIEAGRALCDRRDHVQRSVVLSDGGTVTLSSSRQLGESVSEHCYAVLQGPPLVRHERGMEVWM